jgi:2-(1,2-epoxy-1,2-dihydrophenyl)acetyl-CoA isomerase
MVATLSADGELEISHDGPLLSITIHRPDRRNALSAALVRQLVRALEDAAVDEQLRAVSISASGPDFCSGADWVATNTANAPRPRTGQLQRRTAFEAHRLIEILTTIQLPVVCAVRGWAAGLGCHIALAADFTVASTTARFWEPFGRRGFTPDSGGTWLIPRLVGLARAKEMLLLGREVSGEQAASWGLVHRVVDDEQLESARDELLAELLQGPTVAIGLAKHCLHRALELPLDRTMELEAFALELSSRSSDFKEGLRAFTERQPPRFEGR